MVVVERNLVGRVQRPAPAKLLIMADGIPIACRVSQATADAVFKGSAGVTKLDVEGVAAVEALFAPERGQRNFLGVPVGRKTLVFSIADRSPVGKIAATGTNPGKEFLGAATAARDLDVGPLILCRVTGDDVDHGEERIGAVGRSVRTADDFDAIDVLDGQRQVRPIDPAEERAVDRAAVHQHLHAPRIGLAKSMIRNGGAVAADVRYLHTRHQPEEVGDVDGAGGIDHLAVDDRD